MNRRQLLVSFAAAIAAPALAAGGELSRRYPIAARLPIDLGVFDLHYTIDYETGGIVRTHNAGTRRFQMSFTEIDSNGDATIELTECASPASEGEELWYDQELVERRMREAGWVDGRRWAIFKR